ncbi:MAG: hypothetical protein O2780_19380 [Proteobacteria bacterium]|jgi:hypothetical protein|nr:hypothetical protein [Pseudomonadota bacterium]
MNIMTRTICCVLSVVLAGCSDNDSPTPMRSPPSAVAAAPITLHGSIIDGDVSGGTIYVFAAEDVVAALEAASASEDRGAALAGAGPIRTLARGATDNGEYRIELSEDLAGTAVFLEFDGAGATDLTFGGVPFDMESVAVLGAAGSGMRVNITPYTSVIAALVRRMLPMDAAAISAAIQDATGSVVAALGQDATGTILPANADPIALVDFDLLGESARALGVKVRGAALGSGLAPFEVFDALALDSADGVIDGQVDGAADAGVVRVATILNAGGPLDETVVAGSCAVTADLLRRACEVDIMDDFLEAVAACQDGTGDDLEDCLGEAGEERDEVENECATVSAARVEVCSDLEDAVHEVEFGEAFAARFVDPRNIGTSVQPNPYLPLVPGNVWEYESEFIDEEDGEEVTETIIVTVTDDVKLIEGIGCLVINDRVFEDGELIEDTDDWLAQDVDGNVWYCGEIARNYEVFEGDEPEVPELTDIDGSWKAGRENAKAGILMPANPIIGSVLRTEVLYGEAEDVIRVVSLSGDEETDVASCDGECLVMADTTPLEADAFEHKFYKPGVGFLVEIDLVSGARAELVSFGSAGAGGDQVLADAKLLIEHNATDEDTGFQGFADGPPWDRLTIADDSGPIVSAWAGGGLLGFGLTEFFFETSEPPNDEVPIDDVLARLDEGDYDFEADFAAGGSSLISATVTHDIPAGPEGLTPLDEATGVDPLNTVITWGEVTSDIDDEEIDIVGYQVILEQDAAPYDVDGFAKPVMSVYLSADARSLTITPEFMVEDACYEYEVLAIEASGNQTLSAASFETGDGCVEMEEPDDPAGLKAAKLLIEHNATDGDTGFQGFADGEPWYELTITDPNDADILTVEPGGGLGDFGLTELFFETSEPPNAVVSIADVLARLPQGNYTFAASIVDGGASEMTAIFTHVIPAGPVLVSPEPEAEDVDPGNTVLTWEPVTMDLDGDAVTIVGYQVIVVEEHDEDEFPSGFAQPELSVYLPPTATSFRVPAEFMRPDTDYEWEVLAIEASGNQTLSGAEFSTPEN